MTFEGKRDEVLLLDFSDIRPYGSPIRGMQNRPASGPAPLMSAIAAISTLREAGMPPWRAAMYADHYVAECVLVGGARRAARMATKHWKDASIFDFISLKRGGFLWSSNNSVMADQEFRDACVKVHALVQYETEYKSSLQTLLLDGIITTIEAHAYRVLRELTEAAYYDKTGEPGIINVDKLTDKSDGMEKYADGLFAESDKYKLDTETLALMKSLAETAIRSDHRMIVNPCSEIVLLTLGAYCTIADVVPFHAQNDDDAEDAFRTATRALIRTNLMDCLYNREVKRTNRIGVGMTGFHEWVYSRFGFTWGDIVDENKSKDMWLMLSRFKRAIVDESEIYSAELGVTTPHTNTTFKPAGCASLETKIKTVGGVLSMKALFAEHGRSDLAALPDGTWLDPLHPTFVLDENNDEKIVTKLYVNGVKEVFEVTFEDGVIAKLTGNHKLKTADGWKRVDALTEGDDTIQIVSSVSKLMTIKRITKLQPELTVDIEVADTHSYQIENGVVSHNTTSKLFGLTEGAHLPAMREYIRWVQFRNDDALVEEYASKGYPIKQLASYEGTTVVGFPTKPAICKLDGGKWVVTASEATPEEQYEFLRLLEKYWITGVEEDSFTPLSESGNNISYTMKYNPKVVDYNHFLNTMINGQFNIRCCSVMPQEDTSAYEYLPEEAVSREVFKEISNAITDDDIKEDIGLEHVDCGTGGCPIDFNDE